MKRSTQIIVAVLVVLVIPIIHLTNKRLAMETLVGCYIARNDKNIYTLTIQSHDMTVVRGILSYRNHQMDSSAGIFEGTFLNDFLIGDYTMRVEGGDFVRQMAFRKDGDTFYQGEGEVQLEGNRQVLINPKTISYENAIAFKKDDSCSK